MFRLVGMGIEFNVLRIFWCNITSNSNNSYANNSFSIHVCNWFRRIIMCNNRSLNRKARHKKGKRILQFFSIYNIGYSNFQLHNYKYFQKIDIASIHKQLRNYRFRILSCIYCCNNYDARWIQRNA